MPDLSKPLPWDPVTSVCWGRGGECRGLHLALERGQRLQEQSVLRVTVRGARGAGCRVRARGLPLAGPSVQTEV